MPKLHRLDREWEDNAVDIWREAGFEAYLQDMLDHSNYLLASTMTNPGLAPPPYLGSGVIDRDIYGDKYPNTAEYTKLQADIEDAQKFISELAVPRLPAASASVVKDNLPADHG